MGRMAEIGSAMSGSVRAQNGIIDGLNDRVESLNDETRSIIRMQGEGIF